VLSPRTIPRPRLEQKSGSPIIAVKESQDHRTQAGEVPMEKEKEGKIKLDFFLLCRPEGQEFERGRKQKKLAVAANKSEGKKWG